MSSCSWMSRCGVLLALVLAASVAGVVGGWLLPASVRGAGEPAAVKAAPSADWSQWLGPDRTGISTETGWRTDWAAKPPKTLWKASVGVGYSSVSVAHGRLYTMGNAGGKDTVFCLNAAKGTEVWKHSYPCEAGEQPGTRCTPTVDGDSVYTLSREGDLFCLAAESGKVKWQVNVKTFGAAVQKWGFACSPLVLGKRLILDLGPTVALAKDTGELVWKSGSDKAGYSSPIAFKEGDATRLAVFNEFGLGILDAADGKSVARARWETKYGVNPVTPIVRGNRFFISSGYDRGCALMELADGNLKTVWENKNLRTHTGTSMLVGDCLYGFDGQMDQGALTCVDFATGEKKWTQADIKAGSLMAADGKLIVLGAKGDLIIAAAAPDGYKELARTKALTGQCWTMPVLAGGRIYGRSHEGDLVCLDVRGK